MAIFGLEVSEFIAILAVCIAGASSMLTAVIFLKTYSRNRKSEQIKIAREIRDKINENHTKYINYVSQNEFPSEGSIEDKGKWIDEVLVLSGIAKGQIRYITYLVEQKEIDDTGVLNYYKKGIYDNLIFVDKWEAFIEQIIKQEEKIIPDSAFPTDIAKGRNEIQQMMKVWR